MTERYADVIARARARSSGADRRRRRGSRLARAHTDSAPRSRPSCTRCSSCSRPTSAPTAVHDPAEAVDVHLADSLAALELPDAARRAPASPTSAPAQACQACRSRSRSPTSASSLVDSQRRKCAFLERAVATLGLANAEVACARAEELAETDRDVVTARALAALPVLCEYAAPLLAPGGVLVAWKGAVGAAEDADGLAAAATLGLEREAVRPVQPYAGSEHRHPARLPQDRAHARRLSPARRAWPAKRPLRAA